MYGDQYKNKSYFGRHLFAIDRLRLIPYCFSTQYELSPLLIKTQHELSPLLITIQYELSPLLINIQY
jgi:hypothetical protein